MFHWEMTQMIHPYGFSEVKVTQSCSTLCDCVDCIVHGILQPRILEGVAFPFSRGSYVTIRWLHPKYMLPHIFARIQIKETQLIKMKTCNKPDFM